MTAAPQIDPRGPRFGAGITAVLLLVVVALGLSGPVAGTVAIVLLGAQSLVFAWGAFAGIQRHPYGALYRRVLRPRLGPPAETEDPAAPTFAQGVGFIITLAGVLLALFLGPIAAVVGAALAFVAAFLNAAFGYCLGCQLYVLLVRARVIART